MIRFPPTNDHDAWAGLANAVMQAATLEADLVESARWERTMRALIDEHLDYDEFTRRRGEALRARVAARKLEQKRLRYRYGYRQRPRNLVRRDVREFLKRIELAV